MIEILALPALLVIVLVMIHAWFGLGILQRNIIFTDLAIAQFAALGSAISLGLYHGEHMFVLTLAFSLAAALIIAVASVREIALEPFIGILYVLGASAIMLVLANSAEGVEHFKALLAADILFTLEDDALSAMALYAGIALAAWKLYPRLTGFLKELLFLSMLALTVTSSVKLAGVFVVFVLLVAPALVASMQKRFGILPFAFVYGWVFALNALWIAYIFDLPTGYTIVFLGALLTLFATLGLSSKRR
jgi:zinc/manganese transport system permease protein